MASTTVELNGLGLTADDVVAVARHGAPVVLGEAARERLIECRAHIEYLETSPDAVYGVTTGFGALASTRVSADRRVDLQRSVVLSHAAGMGAPVETEVVRATMLLRARTLAMGYSGVRPAVVEQIIALLNAGITPVIPESGSLGASGDLAPLAHCASALIAHGDVITPDGERRPAAEALARAGIEPIVLQTKEGVSLINGTDGMLGMVILAVHDATGLLRVADISAAASCEALLGTDRVFAEDLQALRPQPGQALSAANATRLMADSEIVRSHREPHAHVQDAYSLRCAPQVLGAARDVVAFAGQVAANEMRSAVDNPVVLPDGRVESNGNFHGAPLAYAADFVAIVLTDVASMAERRVDRMLDFTRSNGLPPFLAHDPGVDSGLMIAQYTAAALVAENRILSHPASVDTASTSGGQEDHVSMGWTAARKLRRVLDNVTRVLAVELLAASRALQLREPLEPGPAAGALIGLLATVTEGPGPDRALTPELEQVADLIRTGEVLAAVEQVVGELA